MIEKRPEQYSFSELDALMLDTSYGETLAGNVRWQLFKPQSLSNEQWEGIMGKDVNNFYHMQLMRGFTRAFIRQCNEVDQKKNGYVHFTASETYDLLFTATIHDLAEAIHGDIPAPVKTTAQDKEEVATLERIAMELFGSTETPYQITKTRKIMLDKTQKLGAAWRCIEDTGYMRAGLLAYQAYVQMDSVPAIARLNSDQQEELRGNLSAMVFRVWEREVRRLLTYHASATYGAIDRFIAMYRPIISHAFANLDYEGAYEELERLHTGDQSSSGLTMIESYLDVRDQWMKGER